MQQVHEKGRILASTGGKLEGSNAADRPWFSLARSPPGADIVQVVPMAADAHAGGAPEHGYAIELRASIIDSKQDVIGAIEIRLSQSWLLEVAANLAQGLRQDAGTEAPLVARDGTVLIGATSSEKSRPDGTLGATDSTRFKTGINSPWSGEEGPAHVERLADGNRFLVASVVPNASDPLHVLGWRVVVLEPLPTATHRGTAMQSRISTVLLGLGLFVGLVAVFLARRVTRDLEAIARSADEVRAGIKQQIAVPGGHNEAARLGRAMEELLATLQRERSALQVLNAELDQRVMERTREVERLAEQSRYAAVVRERIALARDLHDTLAHSMMAMLAEIRLLK
ncbi:MAG TPA: histidine kinase, partial [Burkholderiales bacterium]